MIESSVFEPMIKYASLDENDTVLDIGAGLGFLTRFMAKKCKSVLAVEADPELAGILREQLADSPNVTVIEGNVFKVNLSPFNKVVSVPPYGISSHLLLWLFNKGFDNAVLVFQKEFADRLMASAGSENYGWLTVLTYYYAQAQLLNSVPKTMFYPQPKIDSIVTRLESRNPRPFTLNNETSFKQLVQLLFTERNKKIRNAVLPYIKVMTGTSKKKAAEIADKLPFRDKRARELAPEDFGVLVDALGT